MIGIIRDYKDEDSQIKSILIDNIISDIRYFIDAYYTDAIKDDDYHDKMISLASYIRNIYTSIIYDIEEIKERDKKDE